MKLVHSIGKSQTQWTEQGTENPELASVLKRQARALRPHFKGRDLGEDQDALALAKTHPLLLIRQFISCVDKVFNKAKSLKHMSEAGVRHRDALGTACWEHLRAHTSFDPEGEDQYRKIWRWKLHPYAQAADLDGDLAKMKKQQKGAKNTRQGARKPSVVQVFHPKCDLFLAGSREAPDFAATAQNICDHLFSGSRRRNLPPLKQGKIDLRIRSVASSTTQAQHGALWRPQDPAPQWVIDAYRVGKQATSPGSQAYEDIATKIYQQVRAQEQPRKGTAHKSGKQKRFTLHPSLVGELLHQHYEPMKVRGGDISDETLAIHNFHLSVKAFYNNKIRKSAVPKNKNNFRWSDRLPKNMNDLVAAMRQQSANRNTAALIRDGRNLCHAVQLAGQDHNKIPELRKRLRTSDHQIWIKQSEAFERHWRTFLSQAGRTLTHWADPEGTVEINFKTYGTSDIFDADVAKLVVGKPLDEGKLKKIVSYEGRFADLDHFNRMASLVYDKALQDENGKPLDQDGTFDCQNQEQAESRLFALLRVTAKFRNEVFHFRSRQSFMKLVRTLSDANRWQNVDGFDDLLRFAKIRLSADQEGRQRRAAKVI